MSVDELKFNLRRDLQSVKMFIDMRENQDLPTLKQNLESFTEDELYSSPLMILPYHEDLLKIKKLKTINDAINVIELYIENLKENLQELQKIEAEVEGFEFISDEELLALGFSAKKVKEIRKKFPYFEDTEEENEEQEDEKGDKKEKEEPPKINVDRLEKLRLKIMNDEFSRNDKVIDELISNISKSYRLTLHKRTDEREKREQEQKKVDKKEEKKERSGKDEVKDEEPIEEEILDEGSLIDNINPDEIKHGFMIKPHDPRTCEIRTLEQLRKYANSHSIDLGKAKTKKDVCKTILDFLNKDNENDYKPLRTKKRFAKVQDKEDKNEENVIELEYHERYTGLRKFGTRKNIDKIPYQYVSGLLSLAVYEHPEWNKIIYILGEQHNYKNLCDWTKISKIFANNFFFSLLDSTDKNLDVFLEFDYKTTKSVPKERFLQSRFSQYYNVYITPMKGYLNQTNNVLAVEGCFKGSESSGCEYYKDHIRFHLSDVRDIETDVNMYLHKVFHFMEYRFPYILEVAAKEKSEETEKILKEMEEFRDEINKYLKYNDINVFKEEAEKALFPAKVVKQLLAIDPKYKSLETILYSELRNSINNNLQAYQPNNIPFSLLLYLKRKIRTGDSLTGVLERAKEKYNNFMQNRGYIYNIYMDMYLLFRLFKTFKTTDEKVKETKNVIIYAGDAHAQFYHQVLSKIGFNRTFSAGKFSEDEKSCLDISSLQIKWL